MKYTEIQPKDGDVVLHCAHVFNKGKSHVFKVGDFDGTEMSFIRPDGTTGKAKWAMICDKCFTSMDMDFTSVICGDSVWNGNEPAVVEIPIQ